MLSFHSLLSFQSSCHGIVVNGSKQMNEVFTQIPFRHRSKRLEAGDLRIA